MVPQRPGLAMTTCRVYRFCVRHLLPARDRRANVARSDGSIEEIARIAVFVIITAEEAILLRAMVEWDVGLPGSGTIPRGTLVRPEEEIDQQRIDMRFAAIDLVILRREVPRRVLRTIECALASKRLAVGPHYPSSS
jgi:hypothetical protein